MHRFGLRRHVALGIDVDVEGLAGGDMIEEFDRPDLDDAMAGSRFQPGGFGIEDDLSHEAPLRFDSISARIAATCRRAACRPCALSTR